MRFIILTSIILISSQKAFSFSDDHYGRPPPPHHFNNNYSDEPLPDNAVTITTDSNYRYIKSNGIPDHKTGDFPNNNNPNSIAAQEFSFQVSLKPRISNAPIQNGLSPFGIALNGVLLDPAAAEFWNNDFDSGWNYAALSGKLDLGFDYQNAHVQPGGTYHYHGISKAMTKNLDNNKHSPLIGYAADGFPIYATYGEINGEIKKLTSSYRLKPGNRSSGPGGKHDGTFVEDYEYVKGSGNLDQCNGRIGNTPEYPESTYYYVLTANFPNIPRCFMAKPDKSFSRDAMHRNGPPNMGGQRHSNGRPPPRRHRDW